MKKTLTMTISSVIAFLALNNVAHAEQGETTTQPIQHNVVSQTEVQAPTQYTVVPGDTLYQIALNHHLTLNQLYAYNPGVTPLIFPGDIISLVPQQGNQVQTKTITQAVSYKATPQSSNNVSYNQSAPTQTVSTQHYNKSVTNSGNLYAYGNCTYYAFDRRAELGRSIGSLWGNANNWSYAAANAGFKVNRTPEVGAIFQTTAGPYGHVGVVESVNPNGSITVSEMNYAGFNVKSTRTINDLSQYKFIH
ncbi:CHAP domain-containing protein [Staphylococcus simiae]|uniref:COG3942 and LysM peptidoglycan-binding domain-containing protein n=1 Tax=Staphylococcus simiae TaxID=308354 RepID=UPI001A9771EB|nr:CHAP domain-containing protein [Staphylococcus simiae]MBO1198760.1 CHAP domain-containing protein [Staphylococcus simiae]MBO1200707.1 CHAP domain-containing protein [Staphylococcus simiae]MBO1203220.1 CHAP domain-containing protein [Staphylococcus simiae]MBO1210609.1 CHAP domain-containing protein [Staphylococcus simiae]MBO1229043.1 CHAP domain-containing protein [Staphylococcus simiae]